MNLDLCSLPANIALLALRCFATFFPSVAFAIIQIDDLSPNSLGFVCFAHVVFSANCSTVSIITTTAIFCNSRSCRVIAVSIAIFTLIVLFCLIFIGTLLKINFKINFFVDLFESSEC